MFSVDKPIYRQIMDWMAEKILRGEWKEGKRIPAVRELGMQMQVNPNTVMRAYESMQAAGVIFNRRGLGFFVSEGAKNSMLRKQREFFTMYDIPEMFERMKVLGVTIEDVVKLYDEHKKQ